MLKKLLAIDPQTLAKIASQFSIFGSHREVAEELCSYLKDYGLTWADFSCRYKDDLAA